MPDPTTFPRAVPAALPVTRVPTAPGGAFARRADSPRGRSRLSGLAGLFALVGMLSPLPAGAAVAQLAFDIDGRTMAGAVDAAKGQVLRVTLRPDGTLDPASRQQLATLAKRGLPPRFAILGGNDDFSAGGRAGRNGFQLAQAVARHLAQQGVARERMAVAGWQVGQDDRGPLAQLRGAGVVLLAPLSVPGAAPGSPDGDPARALTLDSGFARLALARATGFAAATQDVAMRPSTLTMPRSAVTSAAEPAVPPLMDLRATRTARHGTACAPPPVIVDDYYPGGPIVPCGAPYPGTRRR